MIKAEEISEIIKRQLQGYEAEIDLKEAGRVIEVGDGIARIYGLEKAMAGELLEFPGDVYGLVLNLDADNVGAVLLGADTQIKEGDPVTRTKRIAQVPVGEALVGRVVNALGQPVEDYASVLLRSTSGILGTVEVGNGFPRVGTDGEWKIAGRDAILTLKDGVLKLATARGDETTPCPEDLARYFTAIRDALDAWQRGAAPPIGVHDCLRVVRLIDQAYLLAGS